MCSWALEQLSFADWLFRVCLPFLPCVLDSLFPASRYLFSTAWKALLLCFTYCSFSWWRETNSVHPKTRNAGRGYIDLAFQMPTSDSPCSTEGPEVGWGVRICQLPPGWRESVWAEVVPRRKGWCWAVGPLVLNTTQWKQCRLHMLSGTSSYLAPF